MWPCFTLLSNPLPSANVSPSFTPPPHQPLPYQPQSKFYSSGRWHQTMQLGRMNPFLSKDFNIQFQLISCKVIQCCFRQWKAWLKSEHQCQKNKMLCTNNDIAAQIWILLTAVSRLFLFTIQASFQASTQLWTRLVMTPLDFPPCKLSFGFSKFKPQNFLLFSYFLTKLNLQLLWFLN